MFISTLLGEKNKVPGGFEVHTDGRDVTVWIVVLRSGHISKLYINSMGAHEKWLKNDESFFINFNLLLFFFASYHKTENHPLVLPQKLRFGSRCRCVVTLQIAGSNSISPLPSTTWNSKLS